MISTKSVPSIFFDTIFQDEVLFDISSLPIFKKCFLLVAMFAFFCFPILLLLSCLFLLFSCCCCLILLWYYVLRKRALRICQLVWIYLTKAVETMLIRNFTRNREINRSASWLLATILGLVQVNYTSQACIYLFKASNGNTKRNLLTIKTPERRHCRRSNVFTVSFEQIFNLVLMFSLLILN